MGFRFIIGEYKSYEEDGQIFHTAEKVKLKNSPAFDEPTDFTNVRLPSYSAWAEFIKNTSLNNLFKELIPTHPGFAKLQLRHKKIIDLRYARKERYNEDDQNRLEWLKFWIDWALENCKNPVFANS